MYRERMALHMASLRRLLARIWALEPDDVKAIEIKMLRLLGMFVAILAALVYTVHEVVRLLSHW